MDTNATINPGATEIWYDGIDQNCDRKNDYDQDEDTYVSSAHGGTDCNDTNDAINPGATEIWYDGTDQDCDGKSYDQDGDGFDSDAHSGTDCNDTDKTINPGATEVWYDGIDQDCDKKNDYDRDGDTYMSAAHEAQTVSTPTPPSIRVLRNLVMASTKTVTKRTTTTKTKTPTLQVPLVAPTATTPTKPLIPVRLVGRQRGSNCDRKILIGSDGFDSDAGTPERLRDTDKRLTQVHRGW